MAKKKTAKSKKIQIRISAETAETLSAAILAKLDETSKRLADEAKKGAKGASTYSLMEDLQRAEAFETVSGEWYGLDEMIGDGYELIVTEDEPASTPGLKKP